MNYSFKIINSSAGSGKTFKLAIEFISKLLVTEDDNHFKSMLALTFTNKASAEMKDRILLYLLDLKEQRNDIIKELVLKKTSLDELYVVERSAKILEKILYNYSNFNVITIDSFTNNIISSIDESNHNEDSLVELDSGIYIDLAIDIANKKNLLEIKRYYQECAMKKLFNTKKAGEEFNQTLLSLD